MAHGGRRTTRGQRRLAGRLTAAGEQRMASVPNKLNAKRSNGMFHLTKFKNGSVQMRFRSPLFSVPF